MYQYSTRRHPEKIHKVSFPKILFGLNCQLWLKSRNSILAKNLKRKWFARSQNGRKHFVAPKYEGIDYSYNLDGCLTLVM